VLVRAFFNTIHQHPAFKLTHYRAETRVGQIRYPFYSPAMPAKTPAR